MKMKSIIHFLIGVSFVALSACGGSGGGGDDGDVFPTPTLPATAVKIDAANAAFIANSALEFTEDLFEFAAKTEGPPSIPQVLKLVTDQVIKRNRNSGSNTAGKKEDLSALFCDPPGTAINTFTEDANSVSGEIKFSSCDFFGSGIILDGTFPYESSWNDTTLDYDAQYGGSLTFDDGIDRITIVFNFSESGNDGTGDVSFSPGFSLDGIPDESYLVTTVQPIIGNLFSSEFTSGKIDVEGADNTHLCITVTPINLVTVEFDDGLSGGCVPLVPPLVDIPL
jgi:hypothetical protein